MMEIRRIFQSACADGEVVLTCINEREANNLRQRFYRYRDKIRGQSDPLSLVVDYIHFELSGNMLTVAYREPLEHIRETTDDNNRPGAQALNSSRQHESRETSRSSSQNS